MDRVSCIDSAIMHEVDMTLSALLAPLWGEYFDDRWIPLTNGPKCEVLGFSLWLVGISYWTNSEDADDLRPSVVHMTSL